MSETNLKIEHKSWSSRLIIYQHREKLSHKQLMINELETFNDVRCLKPIKVEVYIRW
jgi:hypothetical protein